MLLVCGKGAYFLLISKDFPLKVFLYLVDFRSFKQSYVTFVFICYS